MAFVSFPDCVQVVADFDTSGAPWSMSLWFRLTAPDEAKMNVLGAELEAQWITPLMAQLTTTTNWNKFTIYDMNTTLSPKLDYIPLAPIAGGQGNASAALSAACCVSFYTTARGRSGRGRNYVSGVDEALVGPTTFNTTFTGAIETVYNGVLAGTYSNGALWVVASKQQDNVPYTVGATRPIVTVDVRNARIASQRRRTGKF